MEVKPEWTNAHFEISHGYSAEHLVPFVGITLRYGAAGEEPLETAPTVLLAPAHAEELGATIFRAGSVAMLQVSIVAYEQELEKQGKLAEAEVVARFREWVATPPPENDEDEYTGADDDGG